MADDQDKTRFRQETMELINNLAKANPQKLTELSQTAQQMQTMMQKDPKAFESSLEQFVKTHAEKGTNVAESSKSSNSMNQATTSAASSNLDDLVYSCKNQPSASSVLVKWAFEAKRMLTGSPLYVNVCQSDEMEEPNSITGYIPTFVSPIKRDHVDVVVHPDVLRRCQTDGSYKEDLVGLFLSLLKQRYHVVALLPDSTHISILPALLSVIKGEIADEPQPQPKKREKSATATPQKLYTSVSITQTEDTVVVKVSGLQAAKASELDLKVLSPTLLQLNFLASLSSPAGTCVDLVLPCGVRCEGYSAKFLPKSKVLWVTLQKQL